MRKVILLFLYICLNISGFTQSQNTLNIRISIVNEQKTAVPGSTLYLLNSDSMAIQTGAANSSGIFEFKDPGPGKYLVRASQTGYQVGYGHWFDLRKNTSYSDTIILRSQNGLLKNVTVVSKKPAFLFLPDKTVVNPEATISNAGATVMEVLEKSPGITVSKDGSIIMKGKPSVTVLIDGRPTQLSGADLQAYLSGISASQVDVVELIDSPGARYDASGNAGIINIKMKANRQKGFNGSMNLSIGQGSYTKTGNSINLNYRIGKINSFLNYGFRDSHEYLDIYTLRKYFSTTRLDSVLLEQPNFTKNSPIAQTLKAGADFFVSNKITLGIVFTGGIFGRNSASYSTINWMEPNYHIDSSIYTLGNNNLVFKRGGVNLNGRYKIDQQSELTVNLDDVKFYINNDQHYQTQLIGAGSSAAATKGYTPSNLDIITAKADYSRQFKIFLLEAGLKTAANTTDNLADYYYVDNNNWLPDLSRSNHFLYNERISAAYSSVDAKQGKWHWQAGLRYEYTSYNAHQLGNAVVKDSSFKKDFGSLFPSAFAAYQADSNNSITFRLGRRIDRPPFQFLNPFLNTLNKYTYEGGNPFIKPQYTWNFALAHTYKQLLTTEFSYSYLKDYFSQIFIIDSNSSNVNKNIIIYTRGNVGTFQNYGLAETFQSPITKWWNITAVAIFNHKILHGQVWAPIDVTISQLNLSLNNQFQFNNGWSFELSGYYQTRSQIDLQEWLKPQGELDAGIAKQVLKNKGSLKLSVKDLTHFQNYSGYSTFQNAVEPFAIKWDSRVVRLTFSWRFGTEMKQVSRSEGGVTDEINRAGNGN